MSMGLAVVTAAAVAGAFAVAVAQIDAAHKSQNALGVETLQYQQADDGVSLIRPELISILRTNSINGLDLLNYLRCVPALHDTCDPVNTPVPGYASDLTLLHSPPAPPGAPGNVKVRIVQLSPPTSPSVFYAQYEVQINGVVKRRVRINFGQGSSFNNALLGDQFRCLFCHAQIYGNVAEYKEHRLIGPRLTDIFGNWYSGGPWNPNTNGDADAAGVWATYHSDSAPVAPLPPAPGLLLSPNLLQAHSGRDDLPVMTSYNAWDALYQQPLFTTSDFTADTNLQWPADANVQWDFSSGTPANYFGPLPYTLDTRLGMMDWLSGRLLSVYSFQPSYDGPNLPWNSQRGDHSKPSYDPNSMLPLMTGSLRNGRIQIVPLNRTAASAMSVIGSATGATEGNAILNGRDFGPLQINGRVFFSGDVIIYGQIQGQGEIYSGRNIYIADDLTYVNPPNEFDGSQAHNITMSNVSTNGKAIAAGMAGKDRLALFATNNVILGDPYYESPTGVAATGEVGTDVRYIILSALSTYDGLMAIDRTTGAMADYHMFPNGNVCFLLPWEKFENCLMDGTPEFNSRFIKTPVFQYSTTYTPGLASPQQYYNDRWAVTPSSAYVNSFYPQNMNNGTLTDWIDQATYRNMTANAGKRIHAMQQPLGDSRRQRFKDFYMPIQSTNPYDPTTWNSNSIYANLDQWIGLAGQIAGVRADNDDVPTLLDTRIRTFIADCQGYLAGLGMHSPNDPASLNVPSKGTSYRGCDFFYKRDASSPVIATNIGRSAASFYNLDASTSTSTSSCNDLTDTSAATTPPAAPLAPVCNSSGANYQRPFNAAGPVEDGIFMYSGDLNIRIMYDSSGPRIKVGTRYWDSVKVPPRNQIKTVQAFLFANQYISYASDSTADRQVRIYGGVIAKDVLGRFVNKIGPDRNFAPVFGGMSRGHQANIWGGGDQGSNVSLLIMQDPRFQFSTQLIYQDFGNEILDL